MGTNAFGDTDESSDDWVDVRMTDRDAGEWDIDVIVADGTVEYVDLRIRPDLLAGFIDCLVDDVADERARRILAETAERQGLEPNSLADADAEAVPGADSEE